MYSQVSDLAYFRILVTKESEIALLEAAASLAQDEYPRLDLEAVISSVDILAQRLSLRCKNASTELMRLRELLNFFYRDIGFSGNQENYYDPANSFIHKVLETKRGIPITLAIIFVELANRIGLDTCGISFPGHFLIKVNLHEGPVVLDPFTGQSLTQPEVLERLDPYRKRLGPVGDEDVPAGLFLQAAAPRDILLRMLRNLREIYRQQGNTERLKQALDRTLILDPDNGPDRRLRESLGT